MTITELSPYGLSLPLMEPECPLQKSLISTPHHPTPNSKNPVYDNFHESHMKKIAFQISINWQIAKFQYDIPNTSY